MSASAFASLHFLHYLNRMSSNLSNTQRNISFQNVYCNVCLKAREWAHVTINTGESAFYRKLLVNVIKTWNFQPSNPHQVRYNLFRLKYWKKNVIKNNFFTIFELTVPWLLLRSWFSSYFFIKYNIFASILWHPQM